jgi:glyoxylase-like metal-dependent hydrolase (beta-lactamase superfamily II)
MRIAPELEVVLAPNPGPMTGPGTNQYLVGGRDPLLIDAASFDGENRARITTGLAGERLAAMLLTHIHPDHVGGALAVRETMGVPLAVHRSRAGFRWGDRPLAPDRPLDDGDEVAHPAGRLRVLHTPGHESGHCCYYDAERRWLFTGDVILSTGTVVIPPPDGDMTAYMTTLRRLRALDVERILPGHGPPIERPYEVIDRYIAHRTERERQIAEAVGDGVSSIGDIVARVYVGLASVLHGAAALTVRAHLEKLAREGVVVEDPPERYRLA